MDVFLLLQINVFHTIDSHLYTGQQFRRCLDEHLGLHLTETDYQFLASKYDQKKTGMVNYRAFSEALESGELVKNSPRACVHLRMHIKFFDGTS